MRFDDLDENFEKMKDKWYHDENVLFNMVESLKYREGIFLRKGTVHRLLKMNKVEYFLQNTRRYHFFTEPFNVYSSLAILPNMPMSSFNIKTKKAEKEDFNKRFTDYMAGYDFLIDIDNEDLTLAYATAVKIKKDFDERHIPYYCLFSGKKGIHIRVDYTAFPQWIKDYAKEEGWQALANLFKRFAENYRAVNGFYDIDTSIFDLRRIAKLPYSIVYPYYFVALPLSDEQFNDFTLADVSLPNLINQTSKLYKRGLLTRAGTPEAFGQLIKEYTEDT